MSEDNKNLSDDLDDMIGDVKEGAKKAADKASELAGEAKEKAAEFAEDAKETANEFVDNAKEAFNSSSGDNKKILAGILAIIFGAFGIHKFILGYQKEGAIMLGITLIGIVLSCVGVGVFLVWIMSIIGLIEGIIYLTKSDQEFISMYQSGKKPWF
ncbi:MAG: NINE protein [Winogradskyella sp.]|uniref:NINE protein n=1 Tax=Winogradskyella sp. TaxID=1883156 RepID=UPI000F4149D4|nr:NINE protein [Winogradskyella sp.]RNC87940.1 MAG: NINE protein [Winogradskyella sp.]